MWERLRRRAWIVPYVLLHLRSRRAIEAWQLRHIRSIVAHARGLSLYRDLYGSVSAQTFQEFSTLPVITKSMYLTQDQSTYTSKGNGMRTEWATTSGTSGEPFSILMAQNPSRVRADFTVYRPLFWHILKSRGRFRIARIFTKSRARENRRFTHITDFLRNPEREVRELIAYVPQVIETFASILETLADTVESHALPLRVPYAITGGERMTGEARARIERILQCEVFDRYGMEEFDVVGAECHIHDGFHTNCETLYVEVVDEGGVPVPDGTHGRILVTDLYNRAMPFIRYDTGDRGVMSRDTCPCGLHAPRVWIDGRHTAFLELSGRRINHLEFDDALEMYMRAIRRYVVVKERDDLVSVRVLPGAEYTPDIAQEIAGKMHALIGEGVRVRVESVDALPKTASGKSKIVLDLSK